MTPTPHYPPKRVRNLPCSYQELITSRVKYWVCLNQTWQVTHTHTHTHTSVITSCRMFDITLYLLFRITVTQRFFRRMNHYECRLRRSKKHQKKHNRLALSAAFPRKLNALANFISTRNLISDSGRLAQGLCEVCVGGCPRVFPHVNKGLYDQLGGDVWFQIGMPCWLSLRGEL